MNEQETPVLSMVDDAESGEIRWPGDMLSVPFKVRVTHAMMGITKADQATLVARAQSGGAEGRKAMVRLVACRIYLWRVMEELDLCRDPQTKRVRSRWVPPPESTFVKEMNHGQADDFQRFFERNFFNYFRRMQLLEMDALGKEDRERLAKQNITPELLRQTVQESDVYNAVTKWSERVMREALAEAEEEVGDELAPRLRTEERASGVASTARRRPPKPSREAAVVSEVQLSEEMMNIPRPPMKPMSDAPAPKRDGGIVGKDGE